METLEKCQQYLSTIKKIADKPGLESLFGVHVFLHELDALFLTAISLIKAISNNYTTDIVAENVNELLKTLEQNLKMNSFSKFDYALDCSQVLTFHLGSDYRIESFDELEMYYSVGTALKDDACTLTLLENLRKLRTDYPEISLFSTIIGPSYLGKTQTAFTLANFINFMNIICLKLKTPQSIYWLFIQLAKLFQQAIWKDQPKLWRLNSKSRAINILESELSFKTLGLIYVLIRMRKLRSDLDGLEWLKELVMIDEAIVPPMTCEEFISKTKGNYYL